MKVVVLALFLAATVARAESGAQEPVFLDYADSLKSATQDSQVVRYFLGHVKFHQGNVAISCDRAIHNLSTNIAELTGNVRIVQDTLVITSPHAVYAAGTRQAQADGGVRLTDHVVTLTAAGGTYNVNSHIAVFRRTVKIVNDTATITADELTYDRTTQRSIAIGNVTIVDSSAVITCAALTNDRANQQSWCTGHVRVQGKQDRSQLFGDSLYHDSRRDYTNIPRAPLLAHVDSTRPDSAGHIRFDTTFITARTMEAFRGREERYIARDSVKMVRGDMQARCGAGWFFRSADVISLASRPVVWYNDTQLTGDSITVHLQRNRVERMVVEQSAFAITRRDSLHPLRFDQLAGGKLVMQFRDDSIRSIRVEKNALSVYFGFDGPKARGVNRVSGDTIEINLALNKPNKVYTLGGGEGQYFPEKLVKKNELDFRLNGFENREAERPRRAEIHMP